LTDWPSRTAGFQKLSKSHFGVLTDASERTCRSLDRAGLPVIKLPGGGGINPPRPYVELPGAE
jgi:hypothetical protein